MRSLITIQVIFLLALCSYSKADTSDSLKQKPLRYVFSVNSSMSFCGSCVYESSLVAMPATIHGIQLKRWRLGGGIGYTSFWQVQAMPYFGSVTYNLFGKKSKNGIFFEFNYGAARGWLANAYQTNMYRVTVKANNFLQISTGYAYHYHKLRLAGQIGFQTLNTSTKYEYGTARDVFNFTDYITVPPSNTTTNYDVRRLFVSISFGL